MKTKFLFLLALLTSSLGCKSQVPSNRPNLQSSALDDKLISLLSFSVPIIGVQELHESEENYVLFDVREEEEFKIGHIPGAALWQEEKLDSLLKDLDYDSPIILYCSVGYRSEKLGKKLQKKGFTNVKNLYGSIFEWINQGYTVENTKGQTSHKVHTYNKKWSQYVINPDYKLVW